MKATLIEIDSYLGEGKFRPAKNAIKGVASLLPEAVRESFLKRLIYNYYYPRPHEPTIQKSDLDDCLRRDYVKACVDNQIVSVDNLPVPPSPNSFVRHTRDKSRMMYGYDFIRSNVSVRYASHLVQSPYRCDESLDVDSNLLSVMHFDGKKGLTSIVYLTNVAETSGCFSFLEGSNHLKQSYVIRAFHETQSEDLRIRSLSDAQSLGIPAALFGSVAYGEKLPAYKRKIAKPYKSW